MIIVGGENLVDFVQTEDRNGTPLYQAKPGGSPYNCAMAIGRQGTSVGYITPVSTDTLGDLLTKTLTESGVDLLAQRRDESTSLAVVSLLEGVPNYQFYRENTAERMVTFETLMNSTPETTTALCLGSLAISGGGMQKFGRTTTALCTKKGCSPRLIRIYAQRLFTTLRTTTLGWIGC